MSNCTWYFNIEIAIFYSKFYLKLSKKIVIIVSLFVSYKIKTNKKIKIKIK